MLKDNEIDTLIQPILNYYSLIEQELLVEVAQRFANYDSVTGALEWQVQKLAELGALNQATIKIIAKYSNLTEAEVKSMLKTAGYSNLDGEAINTAFENGLSKASYDMLLNSQSIADTILNSQQALLDTYSLINTNATTAARQAYVDILNQSYLEVASGTYSLDESVKRGVARMARNGITGATYERPNGKIVKYSIEGVVRRDTITAVHQLANRVAQQSCEEMGAEYVEVSAHLGARVHPTNPIANHYGWQGKVYKIDGSAKGYPNLKESTGYPDDILGLGGVNCRHRMFPFFPGISTRNPIRYNEKENRKAYEAQQGQRKLERQIRQLKKEKATAAAVGDEDGERIADYKLKQKYEEINAYCDAHNLRRDYSRELVSEQIVKKKVDNSGESDIIKTAAKSPYSNEVLEYNQNADYKVNLPDKSDEVNGGLSKACKQVAELGYKDGKEHLALVNLQNGNIDYEETGDSISVGGTDFWKFINNHKDGSFAFVHNHNTKSQFSEIDMQTLLLDNPIKMFSISRYDGKIFFIEGNNTFIDNVNFDKIYNADITAINNKLKNGSITAGERTYLREKTIVENAIRDFTKGLIKYE